MLKSIHHAAIICSNYEKSKHFYVSILGLEVIAENYRKKKDSFKLDLKLPDGSQIELFFFPNSPNWRNFPESIGLRHLEFNVKSVELVRDYLLSQDLNVEPIRVDEYTNKKLSFFRDPDGLPLELYEQIGI